jgi:MscS family membrane protein
MTNFWTGVGLASLILAMALLLARFSRFLLDQFSQRVVHHTQTELDNVILKAADFPLRAALLVLGTQLALYVLAVYGLIPFEWRDRIDSFFVIVYVGLAYLLLFGLTGGLIDWYGRNYVYVTETTIDDQFLGFFRHLAYILLTIGVIIIVLSQLDIEISGLVATLGIGSLAIALAAQATLGDIIAGFMIVIDRPFRVGDRVEVQDINTWGDVVEVGLRSTRILTRDNRLVAVPNSVIGKGLVINYSVPNSYFRVETHVGVAYGSDLEKARQTMIDAVAAEPWVMTERPVEALFLEFGDSGLIFRVRCWIEHFVETRRIMDKMNSALYNALERENITIPFPQRDLHVRSTVRPELLEAAEPGLQSDRS